MIEVRCECDALHSVDDAFVGRTIRCKRCGALTTVTAPVQEAPLAQRPPVHKRHATTALALLLASAGTLYYAHRIAPSDTSSSRLASVGRADGATSSVFAPVPDPPSPPAPAAAPACLPDETVPANGAELRTGSRNGASILEVENGSDRDAVVALVRTSDGRIIRQMYVHSWSTARMRRVPRGVYHLRFARGDGYTRQRRRFCTDLGASQFEEPVTFEEYRIEDAIEYSIQKVTLHTVANGNAPLRMTSSDSVFGSD